MAKVLGLILALAVALLIGVAAWRSLHSNASKPAPDAEVGVDTSRSLNALVRAGAGRADAACRGSVTFDEAARTNATSAQAMAWSPFGRNETGWAIYAPLIAHEVGTDCPPASAAFAEALADWQKAHKFEPSGVLVPEQFEVMRIAWLKRRPILGSQGKIGCTLSATDLATAAPDESYGGKTIELTPGTLAAYRAMTAAARAELPGLKDKPTMLQIFSGYRSPESDASRCAKDGGCDNVTRARSCSPHRTGVAIDIVVGNAPGMRVDSSADPNRLAMSQTDAYRWLVANAGRFGFVNYPFEPWHWEWSGQS